MILRVILSCCLLYHVTGQRRIRKCLTGYMTDVQSWVDEEGVLKPTITAQSSIDLSSKTNVVPMLQQQMIKFPQQNTIKYLSMARCKLAAVPNVFQFRDNGGRALFMTVEYVTMYGNEFLDTGYPGEQYDVEMNATDAKELTDGIGYGREVLTEWSVGFQNITFPKLRELDLRLCGIQVLIDNVFQGMSRLEALYLGENNIYFVNADAFSGLHSLIHLDLSRNNRFNENGIYKTLSFESMDSFVDLTNLTSLDFSFTKLSQNDLNIFQPLGSMFKRLSLCDSGLIRLRDNMFNGTSLKFLDISGNSDILSAQNTLGGLENKLQVLYADRIGLKSFEIFHNFNKLEILKLANNEIGSLTEWVLRSLTKLQILDLDKNRLSTWFNPLFTYMPQLKLLSLRENNINIISEEMLRDIKNVTYIALSKNFLVCNCYSREMLELAMMNEIGNHKIFINNIQNNLGVHDAAVYHTGFKDFNRIISKRINVTLECEITDSCSSDRNDLQVEGNFLLIDYEIGEYQCLQMPEGKPISITKVQTCNQTQRDIDLGDYINDGWNKLLALWIIPAVLFPILVFVFIFRRNFRYFFITMRNSAMLSLINKNDVIDDATIFNYDVFLSYCNEDRAWVLDHLLPHVEKDCNISVCLHERDFQVGLSILENIVSCMDRSRAIMLVISQRFLLSQWCQFEMHLAQHRLLETRREDLVLILLEDIPRRLRPNTLHYLMLTKTYIVWPKEVAERSIFWRRLKKSLVAHKLKQPENVSLA